MKKETNNTLIYQFMYGIDNIIAMNYDNDWNELIKVLERIESLSTKEIPLEVIISNGIIELIVFKTKKEPYYYYYYNKIEYKKKIKGLYDIIVKFIKWYFNNKILFSSKNNYCSPAKTIIDRTLNLKKYNFFSTYDIEELKRIIASTFGCTIEDLNSKKRTQPSVIARQLFMTILNYDGYTLEYSGKLVNKDHSSVVYAKNVIKNIFYTKDVLFLEKIEYVLNVLDIKRFKKWIID